MTKTIYASERWTLIIGDSCIDQAVQLLGSSNGSAVAVLPPQTLMSPLLPGPEVHGTAASGTWLTVPAGWTCWVRLSAPGSTGTITFAQSYVTADFHAQLASST